MNFPTLHTYNLKLFFIVNLTIGNISVNLTQQQRVSQRCHIALVTECRNVTDIVLTRRRHHSALIVKWQNIEKKEIFCFVAFFSFDIVNVMLCSASAHFSIIIKYV